MQYKQKLFIFTLLLLLCLSLSMPLMANGKTPEQPSPEGQTLFLPLVIGSTVAPVQDPANQPFVQAANNADFIEGQYIVVLAEDVARSTAASARAQVIAQYVNGMGGTLLHEYSHVLNGFAAELSAEAVDDLQADQAVAYIEQNARVYIQDTQYPVPSWGLDRTDQRNLPFDNSYTYAQTGASVHAYIIDSGILASHQDFGGRVRGGASFDGSGTWNDCNGHGTHVAGTVGGTSYGIAKDVTLYGVRVFGCTGGGTVAGVVAGIDWVTANHNRPAVANMSLSSLSNTSMMQATTRMVNAGITVVVAAGNSNDSACNYSPANVPEAITVSSTTSSDARSSFSSYGSCADIFAPGSDITSAWIGSNSEQITISGTSMASPHVAGAAALYLEQNPSATPAEVDAYLKTNATTGLVTNPGTGSPNLLLHIDAITELIIIPLGDQATFAGSAATLQVKAIDPDNDPLTFSAINLPDGLTINSASGLINGTATQTGVHSVTVTVNDNNGETDSASFVWRVTNPPVTIFFDDFESNLGWITNPNGNDTATTGQWEVGNPENTDYYGPKQLGTTTSGTNDLVTGRLAGVNAGVYDIDSGKTSVRSPDITIPERVDATLSFSYYMAHFSNASVDDYLRVQVVGSSPQTVLTERGEANDIDAAWTTFSTSLNSFAGQTIYLQVEAADAASPSLVEAALDDVLVTVTFLNNSPVLTNPGSQTNTEGDSINLPISASDADDDTLTYNATGLPTGLSIDSSSGVITGTVNAAGSYNVSVTVSDGNGGTDSASFVWAINVPINNPPTLANPGDQSNTVGDNVGLALNGSDDDGDELTYSASGLPPALSMDSSSGMIAGTVTAAGSYDITVTVDDGNGGLDSESFTWTVNEPTNNPPVVANPGNQDNPQGDSINLAISANDADGDTLTYSATGLPTALSINSDNGVIAGTASTAGTYNVSVTVSDGNGGTDSASFTWVINEGNSACGGLSQEAEVAQLSGNFVTGSDLAASGGSYIHVPDGSGNAGFGSSSQAQFCFNVTEAGTYRLRGYVYAANGTSDSFFVTIDGEPASGYRWDTQRNTQYLSDYMNDRNSGANPAEFALSAGEHTILFYLRDDGTRLDKLTLERVNGSTNRPPVLTDPGGQTSTVGDLVNLSLNASDPNGDTLIFSAAGLPPGLNLNSVSGQITGNPSRAGNYTIILAVFDRQGGVDSVSFTWVITEGNMACGGLSQEAEVAQLSGSFVVGSDGAASGGSYIHVPDGTGAAGFGSANQARFCFNVSQAGTYRLLGNVYATNGTSDSFFVTIDGEPSNGYLWDTFRNTQYANDYMSDRNGADPAEFALSAGEHTITLYLRDDGTRLDKLTLERVGGSTNNPPVLTNPGGQTNAVGDSVGLSLNASDPDGDSLTFSASDLPAGLSLNSGQITGSPTAVGSYNVTLSVADGRGGSDSVSFTWVITEGNSACGGLSQEAEVAQLFGDFTTGSAPAASGDAYIHVPDDGGAAGFGSSHRAVFCFNVPQSGAYRLRANVYAANGTSDSFFVTVDDQPSNGYLWDIFRNTQYSVDYLSDRNGAVPVILNLSAGEHTITVYLREDGARLDTLSLERTTQAVARSYQPTPLGQVLMSRGLLGSMTSLDEVSSTESNHAFANMLVTLVDAETRGQRFQENQLTDSQGRFFFDDAPTGNYLLLIDAQGTRMEELVPLSDEEMTLFSLGLSKEGIVGEAGGNGWAQQLFLPLLEQ